MFRFIITVTLAIAAASAATVDGAGHVKKSSLFPHGRIVGGENAKIETFPHQVSLQRYGSHVCGGSIVSASHVLTAGHCVGMSPKQLTVRAGTSEWGTGGSLHKVAEILRHDNYGINSNGVPQNDVAVLRLVEPFVLDDTRQPIELFNTSEEAPPGVKAVITGWGSTGKGMPIQLQAVSIPIVSKDICNDAYKSFGGLPEGQICASYYGSGGKDSCQGDSGGPLTIEGRLAGIVSWGNGCAAAYYPGVYTEVSHYRRWIENHTLSSRDSLFL
ncbi:trypsin beta-like [Copidosoma floridanum]|uniref:trypsin beta-like n=1 Tax=Copidosoma floridanum TaxID=29053 RepID=UPI0006C94CB6|nr:trypsin beta-like [Copidosoma floridanum]